MGKGLKAKRDNFSLGFREMAEEDRWLSYPLFLEKKRRREGPQVRGGGGESRSGESAGKSLQQIYSAKKNLPAKTRIGGPTQEKKRGQCRTPLEFLGRELKPSKKETKIQLFQWKGDLKKT